MSLPPSFPGPSPAYSNVVINADYYNPSRFQVSNVTRGVTTTVTTVGNQNYVIGQLVRLLIPKIYGIQQINEQQGIVVSLPSATSVEVNINSSSYDPFVSSPYTATITNISQAYPCVVTASNSFVTGQFVEISGVAGMTEINGQTAKILSCTSSSFTLLLNTTHYSGYTSAGTATLLANIYAYPQIVAVGDYNSGPVNTVPSSMGTYIPGSFINVSP